MNDMDNESKMLAFGGVDLTLDLPYISRRLFKSWDTEGKIFSFNPSTFLESKSMPYVHVNRPVLTESQSYR